MVSKLSTITNGLLFSFGTGSWGVPKNSYIRAGVSQVLSRLSYGSTISMLRRLMIPIGKESKNSKIRQIHPSQIMFICNVESPEGAAIGIVLNLSLLTKISRNFPSVIVKDLIESCSYFKKINETLSSSARIVDSLINRTNVFLNGSLLGITFNSDKLIKELRNLRENSLLRYDVSIGYNKIDNEINIYSDDGRLIRPVFKVEENKLTITEIDGIDFDNLVRKNKIIYIDNNEISSSVIAFNQKELTKYKNDYCEIAPAMMLGVMASVIPWPAHSQSPRNLYSTAMGKQAMSIYSLSHLCRADTITHVLSNPQKPLIGTKMGEIMGFNSMPSGQNCIVAVACYTGFNQEDSVIMNKSSVERGLLKATSYRTHTEVDKKLSNYTIEKIGNPPLDKRRHNINYGFLDENGIIKKRNHDGSSIYVTKGDVIFGKIIIKSSKDGEDEIRDNSLAIKRGEEGYIDRIVTSITPDGYKMVKVTIRKERIPEIGDKVAARSAQKATIGILYNQEDMPFTSNGMTPDIIINPLCLPSRMTINQLLESVFGKSCCIEGTFGDATPFTEESEDIAKKICKRLGMNGFSPDGKEMLYNGFTGEPMGRVFIGPVYYQRLKHLVSDKLHSRNQGPNTTLTRQPLEGRSRDGGGKIGEMETQAIISHGSSRFLKERLCEQSDPYSVVICKTCGNFSTTEIFCKACNNNKTALVNMPYISKLVIQELNAMLIKTKITYK